MTAPTTTSAPASMISPDEAITMLRERLEPVGTEGVDLGEASGRILRQDVVADRPSPPLDVSAMDGFAVRASELLAGEIPIVGEVRVGSAPPAVEGSGAVRIMTGGAMPQGFDAVIRREDVQEGPESIRVSSEIAGGVHAGLCIRHEGENAPAGAKVVSSGARITVPVAAALASFGIDRPVVARMIRIALVSTGDEIVDVSQSPPAWRIRDSSGPSVRALLASQGGWGLVRSVRAVDEPESMRRELMSSLDGCDLLLTIGGVSMGDRDFVPSALKAAGARVVFHKVAQRPGKPLLGAIGAHGQAICALPGNPVSVMVALRRIVQPILEHLEGADADRRGTSVVNLVEPPKQRLNLWSFPLVRIESPGFARLVSSKGSGDPVGAAQSDGFVEIPPDEHGVGPWAYHPW